MPRLISHEKARRIAYDWHGGQDSPLYALASSGLVRDPIAVFREIDHCRSCGTKHLVRELNQLERYLEYNLHLTEPGAQWPYYCAPWADTKMTKRASM